MTYVKADETRQLILDMLPSTKTNLINVTKLGASTIQHHLMILTDEGKIAFTLVEDKRGRAIVKKYHVIDKPLVVTGKKNFHLNALFGM